MRLQHKVIEGLNKYHEPMKVFQDGFQTESKVLNREPMSRRLYHMNYKTSKKQSRFPIETQWG
jgi:hypothetical protein